MSEGSSNSDVVVLNKITKIFYTKKKKREKIIALDSISLKIKRGSCVVFIGPNGSGKTTLLRIIGLLEKPSSGSYRLEKDNVDFGSSSLLKLRRIISFVRQRPVVLNTTVFNNLSYPLRLRKLPSNIIKEKVNKIGDRFHLTPYFNQKARNLSGGEIQRVAIAMALVYDAELYLMDELSNNLDLQNQQLVRDFIMELKRDPSKTLILSTHDKNDVLEYADYVAVLYNGRLISFGTLSTLFHTPTHPYLAEFIGYENIFKVLPPEEKKVEMGLEKNEERYDVVSSFRPLSAVTDRVENRYFSVFLSSNFGVSEHSSSQVPLVVSSSSHPSYVCIKAEAISIMEYENFFISLERDSPSRLLLKEDCVSLFDEKERVNLIKGEIVRALFLGSGFKIFVISSTLKWIIYLNKEDVENLDLNLRPGSFLILKIKPEMVLCI